MFWTFGADGAQIYNEFNLFLSGKLATHKVEHKIDVKHFAECNNWCGMFFRVIDKPEEIFLLMGLFPSSQVREEIWEFVINCDMESLEEYMEWNGIKGELKLLKGFKLISQFFH